MGEELSSSSQSLEFKEEDLENEIKQNEIVKEKVGEPKVGMLFDSVDEAVDFYRKYAKVKGFGMSIRTSKKVKGELRYVMVACNHSGKPRIRGTKVHQLHPQTKIDCKAKITVALLANGKWKLSSIVLDHNHGVSPGKARFHRCHRVLNAAVKRKLLDHSKAGVRTNKSFNSMVVEVGRYENLPFLEKDARNFLEKARRLEFGEGDATAMNNYFLKMKSDNPDFFHMMDLDEEGRLRNVFWADARSIAAFKEFGDVVTFDTTYLLNRYAMPFAPFVGVNHHGQSILLGCELISNENTETFKWLFQSWLTCMSGPHMNLSAIITDQDLAMKNAIAEVFPNIRHRWCLWHIMKKLPEKLRGYNQYEGIKTCMQSTVYDSLTKEEFEENWGKFIEKYELQSNGWLLSLYEERDRWVPAFVKDTFWAGMSTTQRSESMNAFFDRFVNSKTTSKQFVEQYENALSKKAENEKHEEFHSFNSCVPCISPYGLEKQFQCAYTRTKFKEFQTEIMGKISCDLGSCKKGFGISDYEVFEDIFFGENEEYRRLATFHVSFNEDTGDSNCSCRLFEYRGMLCRHQVVVYIHRKVDRVPEKYILNRWNKNIKRSHTKVRISYDNWADKRKARRIDRMCNAFYEVADMASDYENLCGEVLEGVNKIKSSIKEKICGGNKCSDTQNDSTSNGDGTSISKESTNILDPLVVHSKGRPPSKRKQSKSEKILKKIQKCSKKTKTTSSKTKKPQDYGRAHTIARPMEASGVGTQTSVNLSESPIQPITYQHVSPMGSFELGTQESQKQPATYHFGGGSFDYHKVSSMRPNTTAYPTSMGIRPCFGQPSMIAHPNIHGFGRYPFQGFNRPSKSWRADHEMAAIDPTFSTKMPEMNDMTPSRDLGLEDPK